MARAGEDRYRDGHGGDTEGNAGDQHSRQDIRQVASVLADAREHEHSDCRDRERSRERATDTALGDQVASRVRPDPG